MVGKHYEPTHGQRNMNEHVTVIDIEVSKMLPHYVAHGVRKLAGFLCSISVCDARY